MVLFAVLFIMLYKLVLTFFYALGEIQMCIHLIEKTLSDEKHKPLTIRPNGVLGSVNSYLYS